ncbi:MAG: lysylphosphatidylglycerol synthase transmembrane domain-containing protein [Candidatus Shapirobacteria bacterium]
MKDTLKKIFFSKVFRVVFSAVLIFIAFKRVDMVGILVKIAGVPVWATLSILVYFLFGNILWSWRWSMLLLDKPRFKDIWEFTKASYIGNFYSIFLASTIGGDLVKWMPLMKRYPNLSKTRLMSSVLLDRMIGMSAFSAMAFIVVIVGKLLGYQFPDALFWFFIILFVGFCLFYILVFFFDFEKFVGKVAVLKKVFELMIVLKKENKNRVFKVLLFSFLWEPIWTIAYWLYSLIFDAGIGLIPIFIFVPIINLIIALPISIAGFGPREGLFVYFFSQIGIPSEKILLVSTYSGIIGVLCALIGGVMILISNLKSEDK